MSAPQRARSLTVGLIGTGRVGSVLAAALAAAGHRIVAATGGSPDSLDRAARLLPGRAAAARRRGRRPGRAGAASPYRTTCSGRWSPGWPSSVPGARASWSCTPRARTAPAVLAPAARAGARTVAMHPAMTFTGGAADLDRLAGTSFGVTTEHPDAARALVAELGGEPVEIAEADRPLYHAALVVGANYLVTLVNEAADLLARAGVAEPGRVLSPLLHAALDNALRSGDAALTGPVSRGDAGTVAGHLRGARRAGAGRGARVRGDGPADGRPRARRRPDHAQPGRPAGRRAGRGRVAGAGPAGARRRLAPPPTWSPRGCRGPGGRNDRARPYPGRAGRAAGRGGRLARAGADHGRAARGPRRADPVRGARWPTRSRCRSSSTRSSSDRPRTSTATRVRPSGTSSCWTGSASAWSSRPAPPRCTRTAGRRSPSTPARSAACSRARAGPATSPAC